jgi:hypothetical protein
VVEIPPCGQNSTNSSFSSKAKFWLCAHFAARGNLLFFANGAEGRGGRRGPGAASPGPALRSPPNHQPTTTTNPPPAGVLLMLRLLLLLQLLLLLLPAPARGAGACPLRSLRPSALVAQAQAQGGKREGGGGAPHSPLSSLRSALCTALTRWCGCRLFSSGVFVYWHWGGAHSHEKGKKGGAALPIPIPRETPHYFRFSFSASLIPGRVGDLEPLHPTAPCTRLAFPSRLSVIACTGAELALKRTRARSSAP